ncbi:MAG: efflux RND transporter periplasmic adaptor subunit [Acidobacteriota bacterium]|nr:efflux RND transporter periplasmic adaptor subunit [Acidobacteriota bacterium]
MSQTHVESSTTPPETQTPPNPHHISPGKVIFVLLLLGLIVGAVALAGYLPRKAREEAAKAAAHEEKTALPVVTAARVRRAPADSDITLPGNLSSLVEASIYARAAGYVRKRYVDIGDRVREGQLMAEIDTPELDEQVAQTQAALSQAKQQLSQAQAALIQAQAQRDLAKITAERYTSLVSKGAVARQDADTQEATYKTAEALVSAQEASVRASEENVRQTQANLNRVVSLQEFKNVRAPFTGIVTARNIDAGALISAAGAGQGVSPTSTTGAVAANGNEMFRVAQIGVIRILVSVPQSNAPGIEVGMPATLLVNEYPGREFQGKVTRTTNSLDPNSRTLLVEVQVPNRDGKLLPGMYSLVRFRHHRDHPPLLVPGDALIAMNTGIEIAVLDDADNGAKKIHLQPLAIGRDYGAVTEVLSGLEGNELVVVNPGDEVREGALVKAEMTAAPQNGAAKR